MSPTEARKFVDFFNPQTFITELHISTDEGHEMWLKSQKEKQTTKNKWISLYWWYNLCKTHTLTHNHKHRDMCFPAVSAAMLLLLLCTHCYTLCNESIPLLLHKLCIISTCRHVCLKHVYPLYLLNLTSCFLHSELGERQLSSAPHSWLWS